MTKRYLLSLVLAASLIWNVTPAAGQAAVQEIRDAAVADIQFRSDPIETFARFQRSGRDEPFAQSLAKITGDQGDASDALDAQGAYFHELFIAGIGDLLTEAVEMGREANRISYEKRKGSVRSPQTRPRTKRVYGKSVNLNFWDADPLAGHDDTIKINKIDTELTRGASGEDVKTIDSPEATVTTTHSGINTITYDPKDMSLTILNSRSQKVEAVSKTGKGRSTKVTKMEWSATFEWCPDAEGIVRGKARAQIYNQSTINKGTQLAAATTDHLAEFQIKGYVNDEAVMTHFDIEGVVSEKIIGRERGERMGLIEPKPGYKDGSASVVYNFKNNTPPSENADSKLSKAKAQIFGIEGEEHAKRIAEFAQWSISAVMLDLDMLMKTSVTRWANGECVDVECTAPKTALKPNEKIDVTAVSISKHDLGKFNAKMNGGGTESVTPEDQDGTPQAVYTLTAPVKGNANFIVKSTSRRGISLGLLEFTEERTKKPPVKTPPVKTPPCDGGWTGTVKAVRTKVVNKETGQDGRLVRQVDSKREVYDVKVTVLGTRDTSGGILNNYNANAEASIMSTVYRESNYAPGKMSCDKSIITSPQTHKMEIQEKGELNEKILVAIAINGNRGSIDFSGPGVPAERTITRIYESNCPSYDAVNSSVDRGSGLIERPNVGFEIYFLMDPASPNVMKGSQTIQNSDGSETMFTWDLSRCK